jgi:hypothetical protein
MILVGTLGFFPFHVKVMFVPFLINFNLMLKKHSLTKSNVCNLIGVVNTAHFQKFFSNKGITHRLSCPHTHQQNGAIERKHRHIVETGLALLHMPKCPVNTGMMHLLQLVT